MKFIKSQDKQTIVNANKISYISIYKELDDDDEETGNEEIALFLSANSDDTYCSMGSYRTLDEAIRNLDKLVTFLSSSNTSGLHEIS